MECKKYKDSEKGEKELLVKKPFRSFTFWE